MGSKMNLENRNLTFYLPDFLVTFNVLFSRSSSKFYTHFKSKFYSLFGDLNFIKEKDLEYA